MNDVYIIAAYRTPIGSFMGSLASLSAPTLGSIVLKALARHLPDGIAPSHVFMGNVLSANVGQSPARQASLLAGLPNSTDATTINKVCASGLKAITLAIQEIQTGWSDCVLAGGMESMSQVPYYLDKARSGQRLGHMSTIDGIIKDGLWDVYHNVHMGTITESTAQKYGLSRSDQDAYALSSYSRATSAWNSKAFDAEVIPVPIPGKNNMFTEINRDEEYTKVDPNKVPTLSPVFDKNGTITAANASGINDGAAALLLVSKSFAEKNGLQPLARIVSYADAALAPEWFTIAPVQAARLALQRAQLSIQDIDYFELNEAFSAVSLALEKELGNAPEKTNINGGAVALGHPIGASGARIVVTLTHILKSKSARYGLAAICNGGGGASALILEHI
ncbi:MAG: acetyl-CoA C-acyltransferase [Cytophagaceae bacterium]|jgi:acetyl-CoA C-acetyltransferase|nr:acetyl-CoA C-acyltransferase [Cytophagaceae bacterium]